MSFIVEIILKDFEKDLNEPDKSPQIILRQLQPKFKVYLNETYNFTKLVKNKEKSVYKVVGDFKSQEEISPYHKWAKKVITSKIEIKEFTNNSFSHIQEGCQSSKNQLVSSYRPRNKSSQLAFQDDIQWKNTQQKTQKQQQAKNDIKKGKNQNKTVVINKQDNQLIGLKELKI